MRTARRGFMFGLGGASAGLLMRTPALDAFAADAGLLLPEAPTPSLLYGRFAGVVIDDCQITHDDRPSDLAHGLRSIVIDGKPLGLIDQASVSVDHNVRLSPVVARAPLVRLGRRDIEASFSGWFPAGMLDKMMREPHPIEFEWAFDQVLWRGRLLLTSANTAPSVTTS